MLRASMRRLEVFVTVAETGGFAAAAARLGTSQPSVSAHIRALEAELRGPPLFERVPGRPSQLTEVGRDFLVSARDLLQHARAVASEAERNRGEVSRRLVFACQPHLANFLLPDALARFALRSPRSELVIRSGGPDVVTAAVRDGHADLGGLLGQVDLAGLASRKIGEEPYVLVAAPEHPLVGRRAVPLAELSKYGLIRTPRTSPPTRELAEAAATIGLSRMRVAARATEYNTGRALALAGVGLFWIPRTPVEEDLRTGRLVELDLEIPPVRIDVFLVWSSARGLTRSAAELSDDLARALEQADIARARVPTS